MVELLVGHNAFYLSKKLHKLIAGFIARKFFLTVLPGILLIGHSFPVHAQAWQSVPAANLADTRLSAFNDDELDLPYYLKHFSTFANSVVESGADKGFINIFVWRNPRDNKTYNARIMENILSLAFFYCTNRPWNIYYNHPAVRVRLEAALHFWCSIQNSDGRFSEYGDKLWNLPATAFATKFMGETLILLKSGPPVDKALLERVTEADRKAIMIVLTSDALYNAGKNYSNQFTNVYAGALAYLSLYRDQAMMKNLQTCLAKSSVDFQSPAGFFYEAGGIDFGYNFNTHHSNLWMAYHYAKGTGLEKYFIDEERRYYDWIKYNAVPEGSGYYTINRAVEMRQKTAIVTSYILLTPLGKSVEGMRAFNTSAAEHKRNLIKDRKELERTWPEVAPLQLGEFSAFSPYAFLHRRHVTWHPDSIQKDAAVKQLPYLRASRFVHQKMDSRNPLVFTYVRQPSYYAAFNSGPILKAQQRFGIGLIWHPIAGSFMQSQTDADTAAWGTRAKHQKIYEADSLIATFTVNNQSVTPRVGNHDLPAGRFAISYPLKNKGMKSVKFDTEELEVTISHRGPFIEQLPLLMHPDDLIDIHMGRAILKKRNASINIRFDGNAKATLIPTNLASGTQKVVVLTLEASEKLKYSITTN